LRGAANCSGSVAVRRSGRLKAGTGHVPSDISCGVGREAARPRARFRAGSGFAQDLFFVKVGTDAASRAVGDGSSHAVRKFRNERGDVEMALHARLEVSDVISRGQMLQVI